MVDFSIDMPRLLSPGVVNVERPSSAPALPTGDKLASVVCNKTGSIVKEVRSEAQSECYVEMSMSTQYITISA